jgi:hypothetical protein
MFRRREQNNLPDQLGGQPFMWSYGSSTQFYLIREAMALCNEDSELNIQMTEFFFEDGDMCMDFGGFFG